jgi:2-polyprenyl-6-methoxyphenol hydroxylase-like FAD-dependent oxidoreductase
MHVLISGAGPAGLTCALSLAQHGLSCEVIDQAPFSRRQGHTIGLNLNGWTVLNHLNLLEEIKEEALSFPYAEFRDSKNRKLFSYNYENVIQATQGKILTIPRDFLQNILFKALRNRGIPLTFETKIKSLKEHRNGIDVTFSSGEQKTFDLLVGADGYRSGVRALTFGSHDLFLRPLGYRNAAWRFSTEDPLPKDVKGYMDVDQQVCVHPIGSHVGEIIFCWKDPDIRRLSPSEKKTILKEKFLGWPKRIEDILESQQNWDDVFCDTIYQVEVERWWKGRVVLIGDAAHCLTYLSGQGPSTAMAGAYILASELCDKPFAFALESYESTMKPFAHKLQNQAQNIAATIPETRKALWIQSTMLSLFLKRPLLNLTARKFLGEALPLQDLKKSSKILEAA